MYQINCPLVSITLLKPSRERKKCNSNFDKKKSKTSGKLEVCNFLNEKKNDYLLVIASYKIA